MRPGPDFPVRCDEPLEGEDLTWVLYGSGGCTLFDAAKLAALGGFDEVYEPAYVEDLDLGVRAWQRGWASVYCRDARVLHLHRATTSKYFSADQLDRALEFNYIRFLARAAGDRRMWRENIVRLNLAKKVDALAFASRQSVVVHDSHFDFFDLTDGSVAVFPGKTASSKPVVLVVSPYLPFPLAHGAAVRIYNLMRRAARDFDLVLVCFVEEARPAPAELLEICVEIVTVRRPGTHALPSTARPDTVEEFDSPSVSCRATAYDREMESGSGPARIYSDGAVCGRLQRRRARFWWSTTSPTICSRKCWRARRIGRPGGSMSDG